MTRDKALQARQKLVDSLPITGLLLRGSLLERIVHQPVVAQNALRAKPCGLCADGSRKPRGKKRD
jgi:hypothetical protein